MVGAPGAVLDRGEISSTVGRGHPGAIRVSAAGEPAAGRTDLGEHLGGGPPPYIGRSYEAF